MARIEGQTGRQLTAALIGEHLLPISRVGRIVLPKGDEKLFPLLLRPRTWRHASLPPLRKDKILVCASAVSLRTLCCFYE